MTKECYHCHRIGTREFVPYGDSAWCCSRDDLCRKRAVLREIREQYRNAPIENVDDSNVVGFGNRAQPVLPPRPPRKPT